jgi:hypothetical protein
VRAGCRARRGDHGLLAGGHDQGLVFALLAYAASERQSNRAQGIPTGRLQEADDRQLQWVITAGLAPLLCRAISGGINQVLPARRDALRGADLTAMLRHGNLVEATLEMIEACERLGTRVALLKGISISGQHYPAAHLRPMGDIDVLVSEPAYGAVESAMLLLGYTRDTDYREREGSHHGAPLFHPHRRVWVEIHTSLFPQDASLRTGRLFSPSHVAAHFVASSFLGRPVNRLSDELQLVYIASSWLRDLSRHGVHASFVPPLLDALYLLKATKRTLDWEGLLGWLDNAMAIASLYVMLTYLSRRGLHDVSPTILSRLASGQDIVGSLELAIIHAILDKHLIGAKPFRRPFSDWHALIVLQTLLAPGSSARKLLSLPWNLVFPPSIPNRYSVRYQLERMARLWRGRA